LSDATAAGEPLLPPVEDLRTVSTAVAVAVAVAATEEGLAQVPVDDPVLQVRQAMWWPEYPIIEVADK
jgi:malate dehydrogenase (oxaloacetate-decarboxylating)